MGVAGRKDGCSRLGGVGMAGWRSWGGSVGRDGSGRLGGVGVAN